MVTEVIPVGVTLSGVVAAEEVAPGVGNDPSAPSAVQECNWESSYDVAVSQNASAASGFTQVTDSCA